LLSLFRTAAGAAAGAGATTGLISYLASATGGGLGADEATAGPLSSCGVASPFPLSILCVTIYLTSFYPPVIPSTLL
jgi:hypothetical protein